MPRKAKQPKLRTTGTESEEQIALFLWADLETRNHPELEWMYAVPNAGRRSPRMGAQMKAEGLKPGVPDICLPVPTFRAKRIGLFVDGETWHALYIEIKVGDNKPTKDQIRWLAGLREQGNYTAVVHGGWQVASKLILAYLDGEL